MRLNRCLALFGALCVFSAGCCRGSPGPLASSDVGMPSSAVVVSGRTGEVLSFPSLLTGNTVLHAEKFFSYDTVIPMSGVVYLWPADDGWITAQYSRSAAFALSEGSQGSGMLYRIPDSVSLVTIVPSAEIVATPGAVEALERSAELMSQATRNAPVPLTVQVGQSGGSFSIPLYVDANDPGFLANPGSAALAYSLHTSNGVVTGGRIVVRGLLPVYYNWDNFIVAMDHEMGHAVLNLGHLDPAGETGVMSATGVLYSYRDFTDREKLVVTMMRRRKPGSTLTGMVESDRTLARSGRASSTSWELVCVLDGA